MINTLIIETDALPPPSRGKTLRCRVREALTVPAGDSALGVGDWTFDELFDAAGLDAQDREAFARSSELAIHPGGWQSWSAGWELMERERLPRKVALLPELMKLTNRDKERPPDGASWITGHFIIYLRAGDRYLCIASMEGDGLAPVTFYINRKKQRVKAEVFAPGKTWRAGEAVAELTIFFARSFFPFKDSLKTLYRQEEAFRTIDFLRASARETEPRSKRNLPGGYASWYNHYTNINEALILEDLDGLSRTENLLKSRYIDKGRPLVFQIDDGWQRAVGDWEINRERFPRGLKYIAERIEAAGFIPGLWLAPFLVTRRCRVFQERSEWLLRETVPGAEGTHQGEKQGKFVVAGFNHLWDKQYYCLDISRRDVRDYLKDLIDRAIDEWGFRYLKLDFLYTGLFSGAFAESGAPHEHYEKALEILTRRTSTAAGLPVTYLGCGVPLGLSYRRFPLSRTGADTREAWDWLLPRLLGHVGRPSAWINLRDTIGRTHLDGAVYLSDPDVIFLRSKNCKLNETEKELIALVNFLLAGQIMFSDDPLHLSDGDVALTRRINALYEQLEGDDYGALRIGADVFRLESRSGKIAGLINLSGRPFRLKREKEPRLFEALSAAALLVDHRVGRTNDSVTFARRSISLG